MNPLAIKLGGAAIALSIAFTGGWRAKATFVDAAHAKALEAAQEAHVEALEALQADLDAATRETLRLAAEIDDHDAHTRTVTQTIIKEVPQYVDRSTPDCDLSLSSGAIGLFNAAAAGVAPGPVTGGYAAGERADPVSELAGNATDR